MKIVNELELEVLYLKCEINILIKIIFDFCEKMIGIGKIILLLIFGYYLIENYMIISKKWVRCFCNEIRN